MSNNLVVRRICALCAMRLASPALIGGTASVESDRDITPDKDGYPFIPGTTLAGVLRAALGHDEADLLFGKMHLGRGGGEIKQSPLWIYDAALFSDGDNPAVVITLDGVSLDENNRNDKDEAVRGKGFLDHFNKAAKDKAKYDMQAVEKDSAFSLRLRLDIRENDEGLEAAFGALLRRLDGLYVGGRTSRGFGKLRCEAVYRRVFDFAAEDRREQMKAWLAFDDWGVLAGESRLADAFRPREDISTVLAELELVGSVLVRDVYSIEGDEDHAHTKSAGQSVIYGTSWAGAIRGGLAKLLKSNGFSGAEEFLDNAFGRQYYEGGKEITAPSKVRIDASYISGGGRVPNTRNKIDRFTGGAVNKALFTNRPHFGGSCVFSAQYLKRDGAIGEMLLLALDALDKGLIMVGGETSVGRGVFRVKSVKVDGVPAETGGAKPALKEALSL